MNPTSTAISPKRPGLAVSYLIAAAVMIWLSFGLPRLLPGDFVQAMYANSHVILTERQEADLKEHYTRRQGFTQYLSDLFTLEWGYSYAFQEPVSRLFFKALPWTLLLMGGAHLIATLLGFVAGVELAWRRGRHAEKIGVGIMTVLEGFPEIGTGVVLLLVFALKLGWFPAAGAVTAYAGHDGAAHILDMVHHLTLPMVTLILAYLPGNFLLARAGMVMVLRTRFIQTARAKGLTPLRVRYAHAARNALIPMITRFGLRIAFMMTGALVVETLFAYPGLGTLLFNAIAMRDLPLIQGIVLASSLLVLAVNLMLEWVYGWADPRVNHAS